MQVKRDGGTTSDDVGGNPAAARWNDPRVAAQALLSGSAPVLTDSLKITQPATTKPVNATLDALESAAAARKAAAARWDDPKVCAQALLDNSGRWKGLFVSNEIPPAPSAGGEPLDQLEREYVRGGDPHYPGRFSTAPGAGGASKSPPTTGAAATSVASAPQPTRGDAARASRTAGTRSNGGNPLLAQNTPQRLPPVLPASPNPPANPRLMREEQLEADWQRELQRAQGQVGPPASNAAALKSFLEGQSRKYTSEEIRKWIVKHPEIVPLLPGGRPPANTPRGRKPGFKIVPRVGIQKGHPTVGFDITVVW